MIAFKNEWLLFRRSRLGLVMILLLAALAIASVVAGLVEVDRQRAAIERIHPLQKQDVSAIANWVTKTGTAGDAAYFTFHETWDPPSRLAFAALGMRDVSPYLLRVRALGLESQLYDSENYNPELALPGRFDYAFVLVYLAPLFVIALFHDLISGEREAGRLRMLEATPGAGRRLWVRRIGLRYLLLVASLALPLVAGGIVAGAHLQGIAAMVGLTAAYMAFWVLVAWLIGRLNIGSAASAASMAAAWLLLTLVLPALAHVAITRAVPVNQGVELSLAHRDAVHGAWDIPQEKTMAEFFRYHPEWSDTPPTDGTFHWKWYLAFHHVADRSVAPQAQSYRQGLLERDELTRWVGAVLPAVGVQAAFTRLAGTDIQAQLTYQDRIRAYHTRLRTFYYPYLFNDRPFTEADFAKAPVFAPG
ncbi:DUF3526 domain-containing protein [Novosphingobium silvae]